MCSHFYFFSQIKSGYWKNKSKYQIIYSLSVVWIEYPKATVKCIVANELAEIEAKLCENEILKDWKILLKILTAKHVLARVQL